MLAQQEKYGPLNSTCLACSIKIPITISQQTLAVPGN